VARTSVGNTLMGFMFVTCDTVQSKKL